MQGRDTSRECLLPVECCCTNAGVGGMALRRKKRVDTARLIEVIKTNDRWNLRRPGNPAHISHTRALRDKAAGMILSKCVHSEGKEKQRRGSSISSTDLLCICKTADVVFSDRRVQEHLIRR